MLDVKGPFKKIAYTPNMKKHIGMIAGGTGIAPMLQVIIEVLANPKDNTKISLIFANITEADILLKETLDDLASDNSNFSVHYVVQEPDDADKWTGSVGYITEDIVREHMPAPSEDSMVFVCGSAGMLECICGDKNRDKTQGDVKGLLGNLGYNSSMVYKF